MIRWQITKVYQFISRFLGIFHRRNIRICRNRCRRFQRRWHNNLSFKINTTLLHLLIDELIEREVRVLIIADLCFQFLILLMGQFYIGAFDALELLLIAPRAGLHIAEFVFIFGIADFQLVGLAVLHLLHHVDVAFIGRSFRNIVMNVWRDINIQRVMIPSGYTSHLTVIALRWFGDNEIATGANNPSLPRQRFKCEFFLAIHFRLKAGAFGEADFILCHPLIHRLQRGFAIHRFQSRGQIGTKFLRLQRMIREIAATFNMHVRTVCAIAVLLNLQQYVREFFALLRMLRNRLIRC